MSLCALAPLALFPAANLHVVDDTPGPGIDFTDIQSAISAAAEGDAIVVQAGTYPSFVLLGKSLTIEAALGDAVLVQDGFSVRGLTAAQSAVVRGLEVVSPNEAGAQLKNNAGDVWLEDCLLRGGVGTNVIGSLGPLDSYDAAEVVNCGNVVFARCRFEGGAGVDLKDEEFQFGAGSGGSGLSIDGSTVTMHDCEVIGADGGSVFDTTPDNGGFGGSGIELLAGVLLLSGCDLVGGDGGFADSDLFSCGNGGAGGDGVSRSESVINVFRFQDCTFAPGLGGVGGPGCFDGPDGESGTLELGAAQSFGVGNSPDSVAVADLNGDGDLDLVTANWSSDTVSVLLGVGDGTLAGSQTFGAGNGPFEMAVGDLDSDGALDLVTLNAVSNDVSVLLGAGDGTFGVAQHYAAGSTPISMRIGNLDGDGALDLAVANSCLMGSPGLMVLPGAGDGTFGAGQSSFVGESPNSMDIGDLNGDGVLDLVVANDFKILCGGLPIPQLVVLLNAGDGSFFSQTLLPGYSPGSVSIADIDGDGALDLVVDDDDNGPFDGDIAYVHLGNGDGTFGSAQAFEADELILEGSKSFGDLDGDGALDLVTTNISANEVSVLLGVGDGTFGPAQEFGVGDTPRSVAVGDLDGDGALDVVTANGGSDDVYVLLGQGGDTVQALPGVARRFEASSPHSTGETTTWTVQAPEGDFVLAFLSPAQASSYLAVTAGDFLLDLPLFLLNLGPVPATGTLGASFTVPAPSNPATVVRQLYLQTFHVDVQVDSWLGHASHLLLL